MSQSVDLHDVVNWLDAYLRIREVPDSSGAINGLQVENEGRIDRIIAAVDASQAMIDGVVTTLARESGDVGFSGDHDHGSDPRGDLEPPSGRDGHHVRRNRLP